MATNIQLYQFSTKASPVPDDIIYAGDSASSFDEVQVTIEALVGAYPGLLSIGELTTSANEIIYTTGSNTYATSSISAWGLALLDQSPSSHTLPVAVSGDGFTYKTLINGEILIGSTGADPVPATLTAGVGITIINTAGGIAIAATGSVTGAITTVVTQVFTTSGSYTPTSGMEYCIIECIGGGAGAGGCANTANLSIAGSGGAGSYSRILATDTTIGASQTVTIGAGGTGGLAGNNDGNAGDDTSVGTICIGKGGSAGAGSNNGFSAGGAGGVAGTGDITSVGANGAPGVAGNSTANIITTNGGGNSVYGAGGAVHAALTGAGGNGDNYGSGGAGGSCFGSSGAAAGGAGSSGFVIITEYING
jgi:hypothetical protein